MATMTIRDEETVKKKLELLDSLRNVKTTYELLEQKGDVDNVIDANYKKLKCNIEPIEKGVIYLFLRFLLTFFIDRTL